MPLSEKTTSKLRAESEEAGSKTYEDNEDALEEDVTHLEEDDDPLKHVGADAPVHDAPVGEVPDEERGAV